MTDTPAPAGATPDPLAILRSRNFIAVLVLAAVIGAVVSLVSWAFLENVHYPQQWLFTDLPDDFGCGRVGRYPSVQRRVSRSS